AEDDGVGDLGARPQELDRNVLAGIDAFRELRDAHQAVGLDHRADDAGAASEGIGDDPLADSPEGDAYELLEAELGGNFPRHAGTHGLRRFRGTAEKLGQQRPQDLLADDDGGDRVSRQTQHGLAADQAANRRLARHDVDAVDENLSNVAEGLH